MDTHLHECLPIIVQAFKNELKPKNQYEKELSSIVLSTLQTFEFYKDIQVHTEVKQLVPWETLSLESSKKMLKIKRTSKNESISIDSRDLFLIELLSWFKKDFFSWFQNPNCEKCNIQMVINFMDEPSNEEKKYFASRIEVYKCSKCNFKNRFPRYNHPIKLLETRKGRCGEWMNCFAAMCIVFNYEVRCVIEKGDHVWLEVFSESQQKWLHCDPCENALDTPLMYEAGWNKNLCYCIAISDREVQDVTWKYTYTPCEVLKRRSKLFRESWLIDLILFVTKTLQNKLDPQIVREMNERKVKELVSFIWLPNQKRRKFKQNELLGRQSGSIMWRVARGEFNDREDDEYLRNVNFTFKPSKNKLIDNCYAIKFDCVNDEYYFEGDTVKGWQECVYMYKNIFKKIEQDWKVTYLSRCEDSNCDHMGLIAWEIDFKELESDWKSIDVYMLSKTYSNGSIKMYISSQPEKIKLRLNENEINSIKRDQFPVNCSSLSITVELSGGEGDVGWQHAQLFRQNLFSDSKKNGLEITINF